MTANHNHRPEQDQWEDPKWNNITRVIRDPVDSLKQ